MGKASRKKNIKRKQASKDTCWGFDYGLSIRAAAIGSFEFNRKLCDAEVIGIAYGMEHSIDLGYTLPGLILIGRNEEPLRQAFEEFQRWADYSDADAVDVTLVFLRNGGYCFMISPEPKALIARTLKYDAVSEPISFQVSWIKPIDTVSEPLRKLRAHLEKGIRPYILSAAIFSGIEKPGVPPMPEFLHPVRGIKQLLKFKIRFADEGAETEKDFVRMALFSTKRKTIKRKIGYNPSLPPPEDLLSSRMNRLRTIFPVTLWRAENNDIFINVCDAALQRGLRRWQVQQALCNCIISREITEGLSHFKGIQKKDWPNILVTKIGQRYEIADSGTDISPPLTPEELVNQAILDAGVLLKSWGVKKFPGSLKAIQNELLTRSLLDGSLEL